VRRTSPLHTDRGVGKSPRKFVVAFRYRVVQLRPTRFLDGDAIGVSRDRPVITMGDLA